MISLSSPEFRSIYTFVTILMTILFSGAFTPFSSFILFDVTDVFFFHPHLKWIIVAFLAIPQVVCFAETRKIDREFVLVMFYFALFSDYQDNEELLFYVCSFIILMFLLLKWVDLPNQRTKTAFFYILFIFIFVCFVKSNILYVEESIERNNPLHDVRLRILKEHCLRCKNIQSDNLVFLLNSFVPFLLMTTAIFQRLLEFPINPFFKKPQE